MEQQIYLIGLNYRTAGVEVRERFALTDHCSKDTWAIPLRPSEENDSSETTLDEALILSTCNRVEILAVGQGDAGADSGGVGLRQKPESRRTRAVCVYPQRP